MQQQIELMEIGCIAVFAAYNLVLYVQIRRKYYFYLGLLCLVIFVRATLVDDGSMVFYTFFSGVSLTMGRKVEFFCSYAGVPLTLLFLHSLFKFPSISKYINAFLVVTSTFLLFVLITPYQVFYHTLDIYNLIILFSYLLIFWILIKAVRKKKTGSMFLLTGTLLCFLFVFTELLKTSEIIFISVGPNLVNTGFLVFLFFNSIALSEIYAKSFQENKELNRDLESLVDAKTSELTRSSMLRETLIRIISHDLRGPLSNLKSVVGLVQDKQIDLPQAQEFMETIGKGVDHSVQMLDELIEWGNAATGQKEIKQEPIEIGPVIRQAIDRMKTHIDDKNLNVKIRGTSEANCLFDRNALKVVIRNLISNAIKFTEKGGAVEVDVQTKDKKLVFLVKDTGIGIPSDMMENLFQMKKDNKRPGTDNEKSSGVGLFICKDLIEQNNGTIEAFNNPVGKGSIFKVTMKRI